MKHQIVSALVGTLISLVLVNGASANQNVSLNFDVTYTSHSVFALPVIMEPTYGTMSFSFDVASGDVYKSGSYSYLNLASGTNSVMADSSSFSAISSPTIAWSGTSSGTAYIRKDESTGLYQLYAGRSQFDMVHSLNKIYHYDKSLEVFSPSVAVASYSPFEDPLRFVHELVATGASFESSLMQKKWYRVGTQTYIEGAYFSTSLYTLGFGSQWMGGGAWITSASIPSVSEPSEALMLMMGVCVVLPWVSNRRRKSS